MSLRDVNIGYGYFVLKRASHSGGFREKKGVFGVEIWEYCKVIGSASEGQDGFLCYYKTTKPQIFPLKAEAWELAIARLGQEGWELVAVENNTFFFKRPKGR
jgi:hypothetical protein